MFFKRLFSAVFSVMVLFSCIPQPYAEANGSAEDIYVPYGTVLECYTESDIKETADNLFSYLIPESADTRDILTLYKEGYYKEALILFRNYMIDRFRAAPMVDIVDNKGGLSWGYWYERVDVICGLKTIEEFNNKWETQNGKMPLSDPQGYLNYQNPDVESHINWLAEPEEGFEKIGLPGYAGIASIIASRYTMQRDNEIYLKKYFQVMEDFAQNYRKQVEAPMEGMSESEKLYYAQNVDHRVYIKLGGAYASANLNVAQRASDLIGSLGVILKALPSENAVGSGIEYFSSPEAVFTDKLEEETYNLIDPVRFARIMYHMMYSEMERVYVYLDLNAIANQQQLGLSSCFRYACIFKDFTPSRNRLDTLTEKMNNLLVSSMHPDGGVLEKSFNYNIGDVSQKKYMTAFAEVMAPEFAEKTDSAAQICGYWDKLEEGYKSNLGILPNVGNMSNLGTPAIWNNASKKAELEEKTKKNRELKYESVYFPYSGYAALRNNWDVDGLYMGVYNNNYRSTGHCMAGVNGILNLSAYGRTMLLSGGAPWYGTSYAEAYPEFIKNGYDEINGYYLETSSRKISTVMVNGKSQAVTNNSYGENGEFIAENGAVTSAPEEPLPFRWSTSDSFDFEEGIWQGGYTPFDSEESLTEEYTSEDIERSADHTRQIIFVKEAGLWIVLDDMENMNARTNEYQQVWNFAANNEGNANLNGYSDEQIILDEEDNTVKTCDPNGPNLFIKNYSNNDLNYIKYSGYFEKGKKAWGWIKGVGTAEQTGTYVPRTDVLVGWEDSGKKGENSKVVSVLAPSEDLESPIVRSEDLSGPNVTGFEIVTSNGCGITYKTSDEEQIYFDNGVNIIAKTILVLKSENGVKGIALSCSKINEELGEGDYEFSLKDGQIALKSIAVPERFTWMNTKDGGYVPVYSDEEYYQMLIENGNYENVENDYYSLTRENFKEYIDKNYAYFRIDKEKFSKISHPEYLYDALPETMSFEDFCENINNYIDEMFAQVRIDMNQAFWHSTSGEFFRWSEAAAIYYAPLYIGFYLPESYAVLDMGITLTKKDANTDIRTAKMIGFVNAELPYKMQYSSIVAEREKSTCGYYNSLKETIDENYNELGDPLSFVFSQVNTPMQSVERTVPESLLKSVRSKESSELLIKVYGGNNVSVVTDPESTFAPYVMVTYDKSAVLYDMDNLNNENFVSAVSAYALITGNSTGRLELIKYPEYVLEEMKDAAHDDAEIYFEKLRIAVEGFIEDVDIFYNYAAMFKSETGNTNNQYYQGAYFNKNDFNAYYTYAYVGFDVPKRKGLTEGKLTLTSTNANMVNSRSVSVYAYSNAEVPPNPYTDSGVEWKRYEEGTDIYNFWLEWHETAFTDLPYYNETVGSGTKQNSRISFAWQGSADNPLVYPSETKQLYREILDSVELSGRISFRLYQGSNGNIFANTAYLGNEKYKNPYLTLTYDKTVELEERYPYKITGVIKNGETIGVNIYKNNETDEAVLFATGFCKGKMEFCKTYSDFNEKKPGEDFVIDIEGKEGCDEIRLFIFNNEQELKPLCKAYKKSVKGDSYV